MEMASREIGHFLLTNFMDLSISSRLLGFVT